MAATGKTLRLEDGRVACERCLVAETPLARMKGLLGRGELPRGEGILLRPASAIHTWFMRFAIDAVFLDGDLVVLDVVRALRPWRMAGRRGACAVLELSAGDAERSGLRPGTKLVLAGR